MSKRFTHLDTWKDPWFRSLSLEAKLLWKYINDDCDSTGFFVPEFDVMSFRLCFDVTPTVLPQWFGTKVFQVDDLRWLVVPYFYEQYAESKETWSAKVQARKKLEQLGFVIENNRVMDPSQFRRSIVPPQSPHYNPTLLNTDTGTDKGKDIYVGRDGQKNQHFDLLNSAAKNSTGKPVDELIQDPIIKETLKKLKTRKATNAGIN